MLCSRTSISASSLTTTHLVHYILCIFAHTCYLHVAVTNTLHVKIMIVCDGLESICQEKHTWWNMRLKFKEGCMPHSTAYVCVCMHVCACRREVIWLIDWYDTVQALHKSKRKGLVQTHKNRGQYIESMANTFLDTKHQSQSESTIYTHPYDIRGTWQSPPVDLKLSPMSTKGATYPAMTANTGQSVP